jgi:hypothetical protein
LLGLLGKARIFNAQDPRPQNWKVQMKNRKNTIYSMKKYRNSPKKISTSETYFGKKQLPTKICCWNFSKINLNV